MHSALLTQLAQVRIKAIPNFSQLRKEFDVSELIECNMVLRVRRDSTKKLKIVDRTHSVLAGGKPRTEKKRKKSKEIK